MLTHMGINVIDMEKMVDFYTRFLGLTVSDRGFSERLQNSLAFMTSDPSVHHQLVMVDSRKEGTEATVNQISFRVPSLDDIRDLNRRLADEGVEANPICHGNAWSIYFPDPEDNLVEVYLDAPFYVPQPRGERYDLEMSNDEILAWTKEKFSGDEGFVTSEEWKADLADKMKANA